MSWSTEGVQPKTNFNGAEDFTINHILNVASNYKFDTSLGDDPGLAPFSLSIKGVPNLRGRTTSTAYKVER